MHRAAIVAALLLVGLPAQAEAAAGDTALTVAKTIAQPGPRPAGGARELRAQRIVAERFRAAGLRIAWQTFRVPGHRGSRNLIGVRRGRGRCVKLVIAHSDSMPAAPGGNDNGSGLGVIAELAGAARLRKPRCELWFVATGAEERMYTGSPDHLGALALARLVRRNRGAARVRWALAIDEAGTGGSLVLRSPRGNRPRVEGQVAAAARAVRARFAYIPDTETGNSDHREFELLGLPGMKLGESDRCHHSACDTGGRLQRAQLGRHVRVAARALAAR